MKIPFYSNKVGLFLYSQGNTVKVLDLSELKSPFLSRALSKICP